MNPAPLFVISLPMSQAMKGLACVMILTAHWGTIRFQGVADLGHISKVVWSMAANIALVWFMFFSGYGMSLKNIRKGEHLGKWKLSCLKVYLPCLMACIVTFAVYALLPEIFSAEEAALLKVDADIHAIHHLSWATAWSLLPNLFGHEFWYVECILVFYTLFYIASWLSLRTGRDATWFLATLFLLYFVLAYKFIGAGQAHFYRFCWTFMLGHAVARRTRLSWAVAIFFLLTILADKSMMNVSLWAVVGLLAVSILNQWFEMSGKAMLYLGAISYMFYLSHIRIAYNLLCYLHIDSVVVWTLLSTVCSTALYETHKRLKPY